MIAVNQQGLLYMMHSALPHLLAAAKDDLGGVADIVKISSIRGRQASANLGVYNMTKFGVNGFTEALRQGGHQAARPRRRRRTRSRHYRARLAQQPTGS